MLKTPSQMEMLKSSILKTNWGPTSITERESVEIHSVVKMHIFSIFVDAIQQFAKTNAQAHHSSPSFHLTCRNFTYLFCLAQEKNTQKCTEVALLQKISSRRGFTHFQ